ncbi:MAG: DUF2934 domain-containing protein [Opitutales bacterium]
MPPTKEVTMNTREHRGSVVHDRLDEQIHHEAYLLWQKEGRPQGRELEHWYAAREIVRHRQAGAALSPEPRDEEPIPAEPAAPLP